MEQIESNQYLLIACAIRSEAEPLLQKMQNKTTKIINKYEIYFGQINNKNIILGISGVGLINMSGLIYSVISLYKISIILNYGFAGGYGSIHKGTIIIGEESMNINSYITKKAKKNEDTSINNINYVSFVGETDNEIELLIYKCDKNLIEKIKEIKVNSNINIIYGRLGSGDCWNREYDKIMLFYEKYKVLCEDMEAVSIYQIGNKLNIPVCCIKVVSNNEILEESYDMNTIKDLIEFIEKIINKIA